jgi:hypothetical protein
MEVGDCGDGGTTRTGTAAHAARRTPAGGSRTGVRARCHAKRPQSYPPLLGHGCSAVLFAASPAVAAIAARYRTGDGAIQTLRRRPLKDEPPLARQPPCSCSLRPGFWFFRDALEVMRTHQARLIKAIKLNEIIARRVQQDLPNDTQRSRWNELRSSCSDSIADTKLVQIIHKRKLSAVGQWRPGYKPGWLPPDSG